VGQQTTAQQVWNFVGLPCSYGLEGSLNKKNRLRAVFFMYGVFAAHFYKCCELLGIAARRILRA